MTMIKMMMIMMISIYYLVSLSCHIVYGLKFFLYFYFHLEFRLERNNSEIFCLNLIISHIH